MNKKKKKKKNRFHPFIFDTKSFMIYEKKKKKKKGNLFKSFSAKTLFSSG